MHQILNMHTLPPAIIRDFIIPYTYCPMSPELKKDLLSYHKTIANIKRQYALIWPRSSGECYLSWLSNDISRYLNNDHALMFGYREFYKKVFKRMYMNKDKPLRAVRVPCLFGEENFSDIKTSVGLLTPKERHNLQSFMAGITQEYEFEAEDT